MYTPRKLVPGCTCGWDGRVEGQAGRQAGRQHQSLYKEERIWPVESPLSSLFCVLLLLAMHESKILQCNGLCWMRRMRNIERYSGEGDMGRGRKMMKQKTIVVGQWGNC